MAHLPDHQLVVTAVSDVVRVRGSEKIVSNVGANVGSAVRPSSGGLHVADGAEEALVADLKTRVGVGLNIVLATGPGPVGVPASTVAVGPVNVSALRTRARALAPAVVVELVTAVSVVGVLVAERLGQCNWCEERGEESDRGLHFDRVEEFGRVLDWKMMVMSWLRLVSFHIHSKLIYLPLLPTTHFPR